MIVGIVENEKRLREYVSDKLLENNEVTDVLAWNSAEEVLDDPALSNLDLIFLDIGLDGMDGITLTGILSNKYPTLKKVILSNMNSEETVFNALKKGAVGYISKSEMKDLHDIISTVVEGGSSSGKGISVNYTADIIGSLPVITILTPIAGEPGDILTITGMNFSSNPLLNSLLFGGVSAASLSSTPTELNFAVPPGATTGKPVLTVGVKNAVSPEVYTVLPGTTSFATEGDCQVDTDHLDLCTIAP